MMTLLLQIVMELMDKLESVSEPVFMAQGMYTKQNVPL